MFIRYSTKKVILAIAMDVYLTIYLAIYYRYSSVYVAIYIIMLYIQIKPWYLSKRGVYGCYCLATILKVALIKTVAIHW